MVVQVCFPMHLNGEKTLKNLKNSPKQRMPYGWIFAYIIGNICMSAVAMSLRWVNRGPWASCFFTFLLWKQLRYFVSQPWWLSLMRAQLVIRRSRVRPLPGWQHSFVEIWSWNIFYGHSLPSTIQEGQLTVSGERMCTTLVNSSED